jgi:murein L,D-transpeptidase YcbB/YkuD
MTPMWFKRTITEGMTGDDVSVVRRKLGLTEGPYDRTTMIRVIGLASKSNVKSSGEVSPAVAELLGESEANKAGLAPAWFERDLWPEDEPSGEDVRQLRGRLALDVGRSDFTQEVEYAVRRFQSSHRLDPNGIVDEQLAKLLG